MYKLSQLSFMKIQTVETGLSDFHKLTLTILKIHYEKPSRKINKLNIEKDEIILWDTGNKTE